MDVPHEIFGIPVKDIESCHLADTFKQSWSLSHKLMENLSSLQVKAGDK